MEDVVSVPVPLEPVTEQENDRRLWIGNLDTRVTEYKLLKLLQKIGPIEKFDLLFHRSGPLKGQPRGYAFVTFKEKEGALKAMENLSGKMVGCKTLAVKWAHKTTNDDLEKPKQIPEIAALIGAKKEKDLNRVTKIQAIEAKLKMMESSAGSSTEFEINPIPCCKLISEEQPPKTARFKFKEGNISARKCSGRLK